MTIKAKKSKINLREKLAELLNFRQIRDRLDGLGLYLGKDRTGSAENLAVRGGASIDDLQLAEISAALGGTAVDVFVYDTRNDSDGGKWRERTQHTSWYNEELNTATRGGRREFPAVAVIVAEAGKVTIYDGDDPDLSMWMVFGDNLFSPAISSVYIMNGNFCCGTDTSLRSINFVEDKMGRYSNGDLGHWGNSISEREESLYGFVRDYSVTIINNNINDVAMTILPNAPIDADTGLPVPTIAVATDGGVSVIKDDGSVESDTSVYGRSNIATIGLTENRIYGTSVAGVNLEDAVFFSQPITLPFPEGVDTRYPFFVSSDAALQFGSLMDGNSEKHIISNDGRAIGGNLALGLLDEQAQNPTTGMLCAASSTYNTGWMPGDIKLATLSDTKNEKVGVDETTELVVDDSNNWVGNFDVVADVDAWIDQSTGTQSVDSSNVSGGVLTLTRSVSHGEQISKLLNVEAGKKYKLTFDITATTNNKGQVWIGIDLPLENQTLGDGTQTANSILNTGNALGVGSYEYIFTAESTTYLTIRCGGDDTLSYDNISIKQTGELITNGTFDGETAGWTEGGSSDISVDSGRLKVLQEAGSSAYGYQLIQTQPGKKYTLTADFESGLNVGAIRVSSGDGNFSSANLYNTGYINTSFVNATFTATTDSTYIAIQSYGSTGGYVFVDNISVRLAEPDRSVNDNGLQIFGEIDKTPVAPGADLVAYSGFSADDYLMQPYNPDLDFGTGDFCVMLWAEIQNNNAYDGIISKANSWLIDTGQNNSIFFKVWNGSTYQSSVSAGGDSVYGSWRCLCVKRESGVLSLFLDGVEKTDPNNPHSNSTDFTSEFGLVVGSDPDNTAPAEKTLVSLLRIGKTAPTPEQIAKIYRDEKHYLLMARRQHFMVQAMQSLH